MKVVMLLDLSIGRLYLPGATLVFISFRVWVDPRALVRPEYKVNEESQRP